MNQATSNWEQLRLGNPAGLTPTIQKLHHAAQFIAMVGQSLLPRSDDDSQNSMRWERKLNGLIGRRIGMRIPVSLALIYPAFELRFVDAECRSLSTLLLEGQSKGNVYDWLRENISALGGYTGDLRPIRHFEIPYHAVEGGIPFRKPNTRELEELARYRSNADLTLRELSKSFERASAVRVWPHHFDTAVLLRVEEEEQSGRAAKTVGMGWAIPDQLVGEPYFYVNHQGAHSDIDDDELPELPAGRWRLKKKWKGAVLPATDVVLQPTAAAQQALVERFLRSAVNESLRLLGESEPAIKG